MLAELASIRLMLLAHPDYSTDSEFGDHVTAIDALAGNNRVFLSEEEIARVKHFTT